jgi:hypothetical protein
LDYGHEKDRDTHGLRGRGIELRLSLSQEIGVNAESKETACAKGAEKRPTPSENAEK